MTSITGLGGVILRADDPDAMHRWYERHLGLVRTEAGIELPARPVVLAFLGRTEASFPDRQPVMLDLRVDDLDAVLDRLEADGVEVDPRRESFAFGRFGWCTDPEGNRIELWEPAREG